MQLSFNELYEFLEEKHNQYNHYSFIESDPVSIPHNFTKKEDIEISGFLTATISWGRRPMIIKNAMALMEKMDYSPYDFIINCEKKDLKHFEDFKHRTFNGEDCIFFLKSLKNIYINHSGLEYVFNAPEDSDHKIQTSILNFRKIFFELKHSKRVEKHISNPDSNSAAKRINMFLRWMVRKDNRKVDFGIWNEIKKSELICPLDVHTGNVARKLGLLIRNQNDWKAVNELTNKLKEFDENDPVKYDYALFGLGIFEGF